VGLGMRLKNQLRGEAQLNDHSGRSPSFRPSFVLRRRGGRGAQYYSKRLISLSVTSGQPSHIHR